MSSASIRGVLFALVGVLFTLAAVQAKPSHPFGLHAVPEHFEALPPWLPPAHLHAVGPQFLPPPPPPPAAVFAAPAPVPLPLAAPEPVFAPAPLPPPLPATYFAAPVPAPLPVPVAAPIPAPIFAPAPLPPPVHLTKILPPVVEALPFAVPAVPVAPTYRAIAGPKTTTHHVSVGYAFPQPPVARIVAPHAHLSAAPVSLGHSLHHKFHSLF